MRKQYKISKNSLFHENRNINIPIFLTIFTIAFLSLSIILTFREVYQISLLAGNRGGLATMLEYYRPVTAQGIYRVNTVIMFLNKVSEILGGWFLFVVLFNKINGGKNKITKLHIIPITLYLLLSTLSATRSFIIHFISMTLVMGYLLLKKKTLGQRIKINYIYLRKSILGLISFFIIFSILGTTTGRIKNVEDAVDQVSIYTGLSIIALDEYLQDYRYSEDSGGNLFAFSNYLATLGFNVKSRVQNQEFINVGIYRTNVYTALKLYIENYSYIGLILIQFFIGIFYSILYLKIKYCNKQVVFLRILIYSSIFYPLVFQAISEKFIRNIFTTTTLLNLLSYYLLYLLFVKGKLSREKSY